MPSTSDCGCQALVDFLRGHGEVRSASEALRRVVLSPDPQTVDEAEKAILEAEVSRLDALAEEVNLFDDSPIAPTPEVLRLLSAALRSPYLAAGLFFWSLGSFHEEYLAEIKRTVLHCPGHGDLQMMLGPIFLEHWPRFIENDAFAWLTSGEPGLWRHVASMYLTVDCGIRDDVDLERRRELAETMTQHSDARVRAIGERELVAVLDELRGRGADIWPLNCPRRKKRQAGEARP